MDADIENEPEEYNIPVPKMETNEHEGWRLFYRASQPEKVTWPPVRHKDPDQAQVLWLPPETAPREDHREDSTATTARK